MRDTQFPHYLGLNHPDRPLPAGSIVDNHGLQGIVVHDEGGEQITVLYEGMEEVWEWDEGGECLAVIKVNDQSCPKHHP